MIPASHPPQTRWQTALPMRIHPHNYGTWWVRISAQHGVPCMQHGRSWGKKPARLYQVFVWEGTSFTCSLPLFFEYFLYLQDNISSQDRHIMSRLCMINKFFQNFTIRSSRCFEWTIHAEISARKWYHIQSLHYLMSGSTGIPCILPVHGKKKLPAQSDPSCFPWLHFSVLILVRLFRLGHWTWCLSKTSMP